MYCLFEIIMKWELSIQIQIQRFKTITSINIHSHINYISNMLNCKGQLGL